MTTNTRIAGFGEVMLRLSPEGNLRFGQALPGHLQAVFGGGEANVCASLAQLGMAARYLTALPQNALADALVAELRGLGVDTTRILRTATGRLGIYFAETGAAQRASTVIYDRAHSALAETPAAAYDVAAMLDGVTWLHLTGITPAVSKPACEANFAIAQAAVAQGATLSLDLNFRKKLWRWDASRTPRELAKAEMTRLAALADVLIGNEEDAKEVFGIEAPNSSIEAGQLDTAGYLEVARRLSAAFPKAKFIAITLRESKSASWNNWGAMLYDVRANHSHFAPLASDGSYRPYEIQPIVDRIGGGDSFCAGLIYALNTPEWSAPDRALAFAVAASALKHTIPGDYNRATAAEVAALANGNASGRVSR